MTDIEAFMAFLLGLVAAYRRPDADGTALAAHLDTLLPIAAPRFKTSGAAKPTALALIRTIRGNKAASTRQPGMPSPGYATQLAQLRNEMKPYMKGFYVHPDVRENQARVVRMLYALLGPDNVTVDKKDAALNKKLDVVPDRVLRVMFKPTVVHDQQGALKEMRRLVKRMTGRDEQRLGAAETKDSKAANPTAYKAYLAARTRVSAAYQDHVRNAAREAGGPVPLRNTIRDMKAAGITYHPYAGLESLHVGEDGKLYTPKPHRLIIGMPAPGSRIEMNPKYDPKTDSTYVFKYQVPGSKRDADDMSTAYTKTFTHAKKNERFALVTDTMQKMPTLRPRWTRDLRSRDPDMQRLAAMTEILYSQAMRIGGRGNAVDGKTTYGLATLLMNHVTLRNDSAILQYVGKDAIQQKHVIRGDDPAFPENALVIRIMQACARGKRGTDRFWTFRNGGSIDPGDVRAYMKGKKLPIGPHKFRHIAGTVKMKELLDKLRIPKGSSQQQVEKLVKTAAIQVGALLGHVRGENPTPTTALKKYVSPGLVADFFKEKGLRIPSWVPAGGRGDEEE